MIIDSSNARAKMTQYGSTIVDYLTKQQGHIILLSDDTTFATLLRLTITKELAVMRQNVMTIITESNMLVRTLGAVNKQCPSPMLFIERTLAGVEQSYLVRQCREAFPSLRIISLTNKIERARIMLLHESGADNFIAKPVSTNTLIEKMAFTIKPQNKLGQLIDAAKMLVVENRPDEALRVCTQILEVKPFSAAGLLTMGDAYRQKGQLNKAREAYETASEHAELYLEPLHRLVALHRETGDTDGQLKYLEKLDNLSPLNAERKVEMGKIFLTKDAVEKAEQLFDAAVTQVTRDAMAHISNIATDIASAYEAKHPEKAEFFLRKSLDAKGKFLSIDDMNTYNKLGINLRQQGRWKDALAEYNNALKIAPNDENLYYNMGMACAEGKDFAQSKIYMTKAMSINPSLINVSASISYNIGVIFMQNRMLVEAKKCLEAALALSPTSENIKTALLRLSAMM